MKLTATIVVSFQARTLAEAGARLDQLVAPAREREDIEIKSIELQTPSAGVPVTIPYAMAAPAPSRVPHPPADGGA